MQEKNQNLGAAEKQMSSEMNEDPGTPKTGEDASSKSEQKSSLKKPDKIVPCPRCNSMETKFCYYNNYNVNQPRHFCKSCQRYWTAGGTMRNVPVGAGRRKNKNPPSNCRNISISEALHAAAARVGLSDGFNRPAFGPNGNVLSFGPDSQLCESMASAVNLSDKRGPNGVKNGTYGMEGGGAVSCKKGESRDDCQIRSSITISSSVPECGNNGPRHHVMPNINGVPYPIPCIPGVAWPIPWNPAMPVQAICPPGYPMPVYPAPYWNYGAPNPWNVPWVSTPSPVATNQKVGGSDSSSPLGKHSRNGDLLQPSYSPGVELSEPILVPKTLRIDDPEEAMKSSIWETLGIKYGSISREGLFKALQSKGDDKKLSTSPSPVLRANPAALSRAMSFQEST